MLAWALTTVAAPHKFTLVIDAGHGGHDAGAIGKISKEKDINLKTALAFGKYVERNCPDVNVIYTRKTDTFVTLYGRAEIANKAKADLFISIHTNALPKGQTARGFETYTLGMNRAGDNLDVAKRENSVILVESDYKQRYQGFDPNSSESYIIFELMQDRNMERSVNLAKLVQDNVCSLANRPNKGVRQAGFLVLRETSMPSCLIELGFISTPDEERYLNTAEGIDNISRGIYNAFVAYKKKYDASSVTYRKETATRAAETARTETAKPDSVNTDESSKKDEPKKDEPKKESKKDAVKKEEPKKEEPKAADNTGKPVFKVQVCTASSVLSANARQLKGHKEATYYKENGILKYTIGESTNYNEIYRLRKTLVADFPDAFIIAFKNGEKMNVNEAIQEFKNKR